MMATPTIHINGTSREELERSFMEAAAAVQHAISMLHETAPNQRDYYVQQPDAFSVAVAEHDDRIQRLQGIYDELVQLYESMEGP